MATFLKYYYKKITPVLFFVLIPGSFYAQDKPQADSAAPYEQNPDENTGTQYQDSSKTNTPEYFTKKELQPGGGGPDSLYLRKLPDSVARKMAADDDFWYANHVFQKQKKDPESEIPFTRRPLFQTILWLAIIGGFAAFVIIYLANSNVGLFRRKNKIIGEGEESDAETGNIFEINYQKGIEKAIKDTNYRLAVRLMFLRMLTNLSNKKIIDYKQNRTNFDYLLQLHSSNYYGDFFRLTRNYEYCWYGQFDIDPEKFGIIKNDFENFDNRLK
ncbi:MAG: hypothetical protein Q8941_11290 [Bacteroidota bacterium]|nr:hypothetical protein [Bacteroidota bacterium]